MTDEQVRIRDLEQSNAELRAALILAGREIVKINLGKKTPPMLLLLRRTLREARQVAKARSSAAA